MGSESLHKNILITGPPGCGKTTLIEKVVHQLNGAISGFFTKEICEGGRRVGFAIHTLDGQRGIMAHINLHSRCRVGRYGVDLQSTNIPASFSRLMRR